MSEFLTTQGVAFQLETIVTGARKRLVLVSPYLQLSQTLYERLREADGRAVKITLIYGKGTTLDRDHGARWRSWTTSPRIFWRISTPNAISTRRG